ncbi:TonB-dependent siderophore receptor [Ideonella sp. YS5]|uniref:TonB-dependent siderophore receptor n=1 Tax=Ideonella sp. YS5 TaxID=3453714 RepID=UPI003EECEB89
MASNLLSPFLARRFPLRTVTLAAVSACGSAHAVEQITITGRPVPALAGVAGFGDVPAAKAPFQTLTLTGASLADAGIESLAGVTALDASVADSYNSPGYWSTLTIRGFTLDNNHNVQRDGLPISAETALLLDNKERIEILKGTSGAQAGTSAPGGLVNLVLKRPRGADQSTLFVGWTERGSWKAAVDVERQLGGSDALGLRLNAATESLEPVLRDAKGQRSLLALSAAARFGPGERLDAEIELSHQSQPSMPGYSMLGPRVPSAREIDPRTNLNNQSWSLPVVFDGTTASLRWTQRLGEDWQVVADAMTQQLRTDDRIAFPFGCSAEGRYDRYCSDGSFDLYDYRSERERRESFAGGLHLDGRGTWGGMAHTLSTGVTWSDFRLHPNTQAYNWAGVGRIDGSVQVDAAPLPTYEADGRHEQSTELYLRDHVELGARTDLWLGLRHSQLQRGYDQSFTTPWVALSHQIDGSLMVYGSWGEGVESAVVPSLRTYTNAGQVLPALRSKQAELGLKLSRKDWSAGLAAFDIRRPATSDFGVCDDADGSCTRGIDGGAHHLGVEATAEGRWGTFGLQGSAMWLRARREGAENPDLNGLVPANVAQRSVRMAASWQPEALPGFTAQASLDYQGPRFVLPDNSARIPGWTTVGLSARYAVNAWGHQWQARAGVDNLFDRQGWRESPYQFSHVYLYPLEPRTFRMSLQATL